MSGGLDDDRLAVLIHEVRSPVAALAAVAEAAAHSRADSARHDLVRLALAACRAIERLVVDVSVASVRLVRLDVGDVVRDAVAAQLVRGAVVEVHVDDDLVVDGDAVRLRQAIDNVIENAIHHGDDAGVVVHAAEAGEAIRIAVSDSGLGIPDDELERIFEIGARLTDDRPGSGLGLPLARSIAEAHGGSLVAVSAPSTGATFVFELPKPKRQPETAASSS
jgi:signal transduction histidine kinase